MRAWPTTLLLLCCLLADLVAGLAWAQTSPACPLRERLIDPQRETRCLAEFPVLAEPFGRSRGWVPAHGIYTLAISTAQCPAVAGAGSNNNSPLAAFSSQRDALALDACTRGLKARQAPAGCECVIVVRDGDVQVDAESFQSLLRLQPAPTPVVQVQPQPPEPEPAALETAKLRELPAPPIRAKSARQPLAAPQRLHAAALQLPALPRAPRVLEAAEARETGPARLRSDSVGRPASSAASPATAPTALPLPAPSPTAVLRLPLRRALVIGNRDYQVGALRNPVNDARAMGRELGRLGFQVSLIENLKRDDIGPSLDRFVESIRAGDDVLVFYAGHGLQLKGVNYLPAVDARIRSETDVPLNSINLNQLLERLDESKAGVRLLLIDACRDNPYAKVWRSQARGLARVSGAPAGTLLHFATRPGGVAADGDGPNGLYTTHLLRHLNRAGEPVELVLKAVSAAVRQASDGAQQPWMEGGLEGDFYFVPPVPN